MACLCYFNWNGDYLVFNYINIIDMPIFSTRSKDKLSTCHPELITLMEETISDCPIDFGISYGERTKEEQLELFNKGREQRGGKWVIVDRSKIVTYLDGYNVRSKHNYSPSKAIDFIAYVNGKYTFEEKYYIFIAAWILSKANKCNLDIIWGGNFDRDGDILDKGTFHDLGHIELA